MDSLVRAKALKSAAKVAFAASVLAGCASDTDESVSVGESDLSSKKGCPSANDAGTSKDDASADAGKGKDAATFDCNDYVSAIAQTQAAIDTDAGTFTDWRELAKNDPTLLSCCDQIVADEASALHDGGGWGAVANHFTCCEVTGWRGGACTPWGPPVPPRMIARRARRVAQMAEVA